MGKDSGDSQTVTSQVQIPDFLRPFLETQANVGTGALNRLQALLGGGSGGGSGAPGRPAAPAAPAAPTQAPTIIGFQANPLGAGPDVPIFSDGGIGAPRTPAAPAAPAVPTGGGGTGGDPFDPATLVAGLSPLQQQALDFVAGGTGGLFPTARRELMGFARGERGVGGPGVSALEGLADGNFSIPGVDVLRRLAQGQPLGGAGVEALTRLSQGGQPVAGTEALTRLSNQGLGGPGVAELQALARGGQPLNATGMAALEQTASGDFLFGGEAFDRAVQAAVNAASPDLISRFGGRGGSGLAGAAIGQSATDAFARQFGDERTRQLAAASELTGLSQADLARRLAASGQLAGLGETAAARQLGAAGQLGELDLAGRGQQLQAGGLLADLGLAQRGQQIQAGGLLGELGLGQQQLRGQAGTALAALSEGDRARQLQAAGLLPDLAAAGTGLLLDVGGLEQQQRQRELLAPIQAEEILLQAAGGGIPLGALLGQSSTTPVERSGLAGGLTGGLGGALAGARLGSIVPGIGTGIGAGAGGLIGLLGGLFG